MFSLNNNNNGNRFNPPPPPRPPVPPAPVLPRATIDAVTAEVNRRVGLGESFTAFEISRAVQASGITERHRDLKTVVHEMYERGDMTGYARTLTNLPSGEQPYLFHPAGQTPPVANVVP